MLPAEARDAYEAVMKQVTENLPRLVAIESLIKYVPVELRHLLSWESQARLASLPADEIEQLRSNARDWGERNPDMMALVIGETTHAELPPATIPTAPPMPSPEYPKRPTSSPPDRIEVIRASRGMANRSTAADPAAQGVCQVARADLGRVR
jgi:hypothetical protein